MNPTPPPALDPTLIFTLWHSGAFFCIAIVVAFFALRWANAKFKWFTEPHHAVYVAAVLGGLGMLVTTAMQGTTPSTQQIIAAVITALALLADPKKLAGAATVLVAVFAFAAGATANSGCAWWSSSSAKKDVDAGWQCAKEEGSALTSGANLIATGIDIAGKLAQAIATGTIPQAVEGLIVQYGEPIVACTMKDIASRAPDSGSGSAGTGAKTSTGDPLAIAAAHVIQERNWKYAEAAK